MSQKELAALEDKAADEPLLQPGAELVAEAPLQLEEVPPPTRSVFGVVRKDTTLATVRTQRRLANARTRAEVTPEMPWLISRMT